LLPQKANLKEGLKIGHKLIAQIAQIHNASFVDELKTLNNKKIYSFKLIFSN